MSDVPVKQVNGSDCSDMSEVLVKQVHGSDKKDISDMLVKQDCGSNKRDMNDMLVKQDCGSNKRDMNDMLVKQDCGSDKKDMSDMLVKQIYGSDKRDSSDLLVKQDYGSDAQDINKILKNQDYGIRTKDLKGILVQHETCSSENKQCTFMTENIMSPIKQHEHATQDLEKILPLTKQHEYKATDFVHDTHNWQDQTNEQFKIRHVAHLNMEMENSIAIDNVCAADLDSCLIEIGPTNKIDNCNDIAKLSCITDITCDIKEPAKDYQEAACKIRNRKTSIGSCSMITVSSCDESNRDCKPGNSINNDCYLIANHSLCDCKILCSLDESVVLHSFGDKGVLHTTGDGEYFEPITDEIFYASVIGKESYKQFTEMAHRNAKINDNNEKTASQFSSVVYQSSASDKLLLKNDKQVGYIIILQLNTYTHTHTHIHTHTHTHIHTLMHALTYTYTHICIHTHTHTCIKMVLILNVKTTIFVLFI